MSIPAVPNKLPPSYFEERRQPYIADTNFVRSEFSLAELFALWQIGGATHLLSVSGSSSSISLQKFWCGTISIYFYPPLLSAFSAPTGTSFKKSSHLMPGGALQSVPAALLELPKKESHQASPQFCASSTARLNYLGTTQKK